MASFQQRGKKSYQYTVSHMVNGEPKTIRKGGFRSKTEARVAATEIESMLNKGIVPYLKPQPFDEYFEKWVKLYKVKVSKATRKHYEYTARVIKEYFGSKTLQKITRHDYQQFLNEFGNGKSKETVDKVNNHIRACVKDAMENGIIPNDFTSKAVLTFTVQAKKAEEKHLDVRESELLVKEILNRLHKGLGYFLLHLGLATGFRFEELVGLTMEDFDFDNNTITVNKTWGYNNRMPEGFGPPKNEKSNRTIDVDEITMNKFKELFKTMSNNLHGLVFFSPKSKYKVISNTDANKLLKKTLEALEIEPITIHGLRHTHACVLLYKKVSIYYVSERLGHKDIETTHKHYSHVTKELRAEDAKATTAIFESMLTT
jgi:integrase